MFIAKTCRYSISKKGRREKRRAGALEPAPNYELPNDRISLEVDRPTSSLAISSLLAFTLECSSCPPPLCLMPESGSLLVYFFQGINFLFYVRRGRSGGLVSCLRGMGMAIWGAMTPWTDFLLNPLLLSLLPHPSPVVPNAFIFSGVLWMPVLQELVWLSLPFLPSLWHFSVFKNSSSKLHISLLVSSKVKSEFLFLVHFIILGNWKRGKMWKWLSFSILKLEIVFSFVHDIITGNFILSHKYPFA